MLNHVYFILQPDASSSGIGLLRYLAEGSVADSFRKCAWSGCSSAIIGSSLLYHAAFIYLPIGLLG